MIKHPAQPDVVVKLAALECASSCVMTALKMANRDLHYFLLGYWRLAYHERWLMSTMNMKLINLKRHYGITSRLSTGSISDLHARLRDRQLIILVCDTARLNFFPTQLRETDFTEFPHYILVYGCTEKQKSYLVIDPIAGFSGEMTAEKLQIASIREYELVFYYLEFDESFISPSAQQAFLYEAEKNVQHFLKSGIRAIDQFSTDVLHSLDWNPTERQLWIKQNNITISSIIKTRPMVWASYCELQILTPQEMKEGNLQMDEILQLWTTINYLLLKYKVFSSDSQPSLLQRKLAEVKAAEHAFLQFIMSKGREHCEI